ncbi:MAG: MATE family efflux transporter [Armatimonadota bacterium]
MENESTIEKKEVKHGRDLTTGSIPKHLIDFSWPMLSGSVLQTAYSIINAIWVGKGFGVDAMAAITVSMPIIFILMAIAIGLTMASGILVAQAYGARDWDKLKKVVQTSVVLTGIVSFICVGIGYYAAGPLLSAIHTDHDVFPMAAGYLRIFLWTMPFMFGMFLISSLLRGTGDSTTPLIFQGVSVALTTILDPILMFGWLGIPRMGLNGTALATIIAQAAALITLIIFIQRKKHIVAPDWKHLRCDGPTSMITLKIGIPSVVQHALISSGMLAVMEIVNKFGKDGTAAYGTAMRIDQLAFMPAMAIGMAASTLAGQNIGAGLYHRVSEVFKWGMIYSCGITLLASLVAIIFPHWLLHWFINDPAVVDLGVHYLRIVGTGYIMFAMMFVANGVINGAGHTTITTIISLIGLWVVRYPLAEYLSSRMHRLEGVWYAMLISFTIGTSLSMIYYLSGRWKKPISGRFFSRKQPAEESNNTESSPVVPAFDDAVE